MESLAETEVAYTERPSKPMPQELFRHIHTVSTRAQIKKYKMHKEITHCLQE